MINQKRAKEENNPANGRTSSEASSGGNGTQEDQVAANTGANPLSGMRSFLTADLERIAQEYLPQQHCGSGVIELFEEE